MGKDFTEWITQADYDYDTARVMRQSGRNFYAVFMCHMAVEKALKALVFQKTGEVLPKTHNLFWLLSKIEVKPPQLIGEFVIKLNEANVATRYPEALSEMIKIYNDAITDSIITQTQEVLSWIKTMQKTP
jgi:HEPN domain-containing protein